MIRIWYAASDHPQAVRLFTDIPFTGRDEVAFAQRVWDRLSREFHMVSARP